MNCANCGAPLEDHARFCPHCGHSVAPTEPSPGQSLSGIDIAKMIGREVGGRYRVLAELGEGGMGAVFRAQQMSLKRTIALKVLRPELSADPALVRRFNAEAEMAAKLNHANTVTLFDFGQDEDGSLFIAMEYIEGESLRHLMLREGPLEPLRALAICEQVGASLADAHTRGIVHRDLKPDNVMLTQQGRRSDVVKVLDFGIAKLRDERPDGTAMPMTQAGDLLGTPQYMAPEQIRAEPIDGRTDVYAMGAMLYEMVTGRLPFEGPTLMAILSKHLTDPPVPPTRRRPDLSLAPPLDRLILSCMSKRPHDRPASMDILVGELGELRIGLGGAPPSGRHSQAVDELGLASTTPSHPAHPGVDSAARGPGPAALAASGGVAYGQPGSAVSPAPPAANQAATPPSSPAPGIVSPPPAAGADPGPAAAAAAPAAHTAAKAARPLAMPSALRWTLVGIAVAAFGAASVYGYLRFAGTEETADRSAETDGVTPADEAPPPRKTDRDDSGAVRLDFSTPRSREAGK